MGNVLESKKKYHYGWIHDKPDHRDKIMKFKNKHYNRLLSKIDLRDSFGDIYNQGELDNCTSNAICAAFVYDQIKQKLPSFNPSRMFLYYNERLIEHSTEQDSGSSIRDGMKSINRKGLCKESLWPYEINHFKKKPNDLCYKEASYHSSLKYRKISHTLKEIKTALSNGYPIIFGFDVFENFENFDASNVSMPLPEGEIIGGHAVVAVGYSDERECFLIRNSWGKEWGMDGYFMMPYEFITSKHCSDFWILETVIDKEPKKKPKLIENKYEEVTINLNEYVNNKKKRKEKNKKSEKEDENNVIEVFVEKEPKKLNNDCMILDEEE